MSQAPQTAQWLDAHSVAQSITRLYPVEDADGWTVLLTTGGRWTEGARGFLEPDDDATAGYRATLPSGSGFVLVYDADPMPQFGEPYLNADNSVTLPFTGRTVYAGLVLEREDTDDPGTWVEVATLAGNEPDYTDDFSA